MGEEGCVEADIRADVDRYVARMDESTKELCLGRLVESPIDVRADEILLTHQKTNRVRFIPTPHHPNHFTDRPLEGRLTRVAVQGD